MTASAAWIEAHNTTLSYCYEKQDVEARLLRQEFTPRNPAFASEQSGDGLDRGYEKALAAEEQAILREQELLDQLAETSATSLAGVVAKLAVVVREAEDNTDLSDFPVKHVRSALHDLQRIVAHETASQQSRVDECTSSVNLLDPPGSSLAAWCAFHAWAQADETGYRIWMDAFKALTEN